MKTVSLAAVLLIAAPMAAHAQSQSAEELTRLLNGAPPAAARPATTPGSSSTPTATAPVRPTAAPTPRPAQTTPAPASAGATPAPRSSSAATAPITAAPARATSTPARAPVAATPVVPARAPAPDAASAPVRSASPVAPAPGALSAAAVAALPFRINLPSGFQLFEGRAAPDSHVYSVRKAGKTFAMIYAGPSSQFPIYDGEQVTAAGRVSVVVPEGARRIAMEHLFQQPTAPNEIHVWLMSLDGADRDAAERIAQSVDPK